ncbi:MAG TPA: trypsin-like serine protease [Kofleriaceae bacterium]
MNPDEVASASDPIQGGQLEAGFPAVGEVVLGDGTFCSGTLIAPSYVLTTADCAGSGMVFKTGTDASNFVVHAVDQQLAHPTLNLLIAHLASPISGIPVIELNDGALPAVGQVCTAVGFGIHDENGVETSGIKRSATEQVTSADPSVIEVQAGSGSADRGDSGGPLLCGSKIAAVVHHADIALPSGVGEDDATIDPAWIASTIAPSYTELTLQNGWINAPFATRNAGVAMVSGIVHFKGAIGSGTGSPFTLPVGFRPATSVYLPVDLCGSANGRLVIASSGVVTIEAEGGTFSNAQCFTSLEGASFAPSASGFQSLTLGNGWTNAPFGTSNAAVENLRGIVHFKGAIASGTGSPFTLPAGFRPATTVWLPVDLCSATNGRLVIQPSGVATIEAENGTLTNAQCFTSLDGAWFAQDPSSFTALTLQNGWVTAPFGNGAAGIEEISGIAHFKGAIASGTGTAFTLPSAFRPATSVFVPVDLCSATKGRLVIAPSGAVSIQAENGATTNAQCFTSLDGASFAITDFAPLTLLNGWTDTPFGTHSAGFSVVHGIVHFRGAISTGGTNPVAFTMPVGFRPATNVYVPVDLCGAKKGRLLIQPSGVVSVQAASAFSDAQCFTSLEEASFALSASGFTALGLQNAWTNAPFATRNAAVINDAGTIRFEGAIASGTTGLAFTLPVGFRPATSVYVPVDLCGAANGRLIIDPSGTVTVQAQTAFSDAQCFTSLEGASFALSASGYSALTLQNGWTNAPFATRNAAAISDAGIVRLQGAIASGTTGVAFTLPVGFRPATSVYVPVDLCGSTNGRLIIDPSGTVTVQAQGAFTDAQCFTSLEGASFGM